VYGGFGVAFYCIVLHSLRRSGIIYDIASDAYMETETNTYEGVEETRFSFLNPFDNIRPNSSRCKAHSPIIQL